MLLFWCLVVAMFIVPLYIVLRYLTANRHIDSVIKDRQTIGIYKDRLLELEQEQALGILNHEQVQAARQELEKAVLEETRQTSSNTDTGDTNTVTPDWITAGIIIILLPVTAFSLYYKLGQPRIITAMEEAGQPTLTQEQQLASIEEMVDRLAERMRQQPDDQQGWFMLGRSYMVLERYPEAVEAYEKLYALTGDQPEVLISYANALAMVNGTPQGRPEQMIHKALEIDPDNESGLWFAGLLAYQQQDYDAAESYWQRLLPQMQANPEAYEQMEQLIAKARTENPVRESPERQTQVKKSINLSVSIVPELQGQVEGKDTLFIYAQATEGPPMPIAAVRKQVKDLPLVITLDDSMAMIPSRKLSDFNSVQVNARISKSGDAMARSGDLVAEAVTTGLNTQQPVQLVIDRIIP